ncbi:MAG: tetratricopeptide repeat protein [Alphaproteobacteria bacterium]|nr:tetratricopeptide repeat protein [Alphaproteobacteria bacterium]
MAQGQVDRIERAAGAPGIRAALSRSLVLAALVAFAGAPQGFAAVRGDEPTPTAQCDDGAGPACAAQGTDKQASDDHVEDWLVISAAFQAYDYDAALEAIDQLATGKPFDPDAAFMRGYALHRQGRDAAAVQALDRAAALAADRALPLAQRGLSHAVMGQTGDALHDIDEALSVEPDDATTLAYKGYILARAGKPDEALAALDEAVEQAPDSVWVLLVRAIVKLELKRPEAALADTDAALALDPRDSSVYAARARILDAKGDAKGALAEADKALALGAQDPALIALRARLRAAAGDVAGARDDRERLSRDHPGFSVRSGDDLPSMFGDGRVDPQPRLLLALQKIAAGKPEEARDLADQILVTAPWARPAVLMVRAYASLDLEDYQQARADVEEVERTSGPTDETHYLRAKVDWGEGRRTAALASIDEAVKLAPDYPTYRQARALYRYDAGELSAALDDMDALTRLQPEDDWAPQMRVTILHLLDRDEEAGRQAVGYLKRGRPLDASVRQELPDIVWALQQDPTWDLADSLLTAAPPPPLGEDFRLFLQARSLLHAGKTDEAAALVRQIDDHDVIQAAMSDRMFAPLWRDPSLASAFDLDAMYRRSFEAAWQKHREKPKDLLRAVYALDVLSDMGCPRAAADAARRLAPSVTRYDDSDEWGAGVYSSLADAALAGDDSTGALAALRDGVSRLGEDNPYTLSLTLEAGQILVAQGRYDEALKTLASVEQRSPAYRYGIALAQYLRALAYDGLGRTQERDAALDYLAAHAEDNTVAAVYGIGLMRSYDKAAAIAASSMADHVRGHLLLDRIEPRPGRSAATPLERRAEALSKRLRADPRVVAAIKGLGRLLTVPVNTTCPLSEAELAERPFSFPFEAPAPQTSDASGPAAP